MNNQINADYTRFYAKRNHVNVYPTEFVVRTFLAQYPGLKMKKFSPGDTIVDVGCGDGRNAFFLWQQGYKVYGTEITKEICEQTQSRMEKLAGTNIRGAYLS